MTWKAIWETLRAGAHVVGVGYLLARGMLLILLNDFLTMLISPQGIVETHALLEDFLLLNQLPSAIFLHSFILVNKNINKTSIIATVNTRISQTKTMLADSADHQEAWRSSSSPLIERAELEHGREGLQGLPG